MSSRTFSAHRPRENYTCCIVAIVVLSTLLLGVAWFSFTWVLPEVVHPYNKFYDDRVELINKARRFVLDPKSICDKIDTVEYRLAIGELDRCEANKRIMRSDPVFDARIDLAKHLQWCSDGCMGQNMGFFGYIHAMIWGGIIVVGSMALCLAICCCVVCYGKMRSTGLLPTHTTRDPIERKTMQRNVDKENYIQGRCKQN